MLANKTPKTLQNTVQANYRLQVVLEAALVLSFLTPGGGCTQQALTLPFTPGSESTPTHAHVHTDVSAHALVDTGTDVCSCRILTFPSEPPPTSRLFSARAAGSVSTLVRLAAGCTGGETRPGPRLPAVPTVTAFMELKVSTELPRSVLNPVPGHLHHPAARLDLCLGGGRQLVGVGEDVIA